jgi:hypothetical protein
MYTYRRGVARRSPSVRRHIRTPTDLSLVVMEIAIGESSASSRVICDQYNNSRVLPSWPHRRFLFPIAAVSSAQPTQSSMSPKHCARPNDCRPLYRHYALRRSVKTLILLSSFRPLELARAVLLRTANAATAGRKATDTVNSTCLLGRAA